MEKSELHGLAKSYFNDEINTHDYRQQRTKLIDAIVENDAEKIQQAAVIKKQDKQLDLQKKTRVGDYKVYLGLILIMLSVAVIAMNKDSIKGYLDKALLPTIDHVNNELE